MIDMARDVKVNGFPKELTIIPISHIQSLVNISSSLSEVRWRAQLSPDFPLRILRLWLIGNDVDCQHLFLPLFTDIEQDKGAIYKITNTITKECYIGRTQHPAKRIKAHINDAFNINKENYEYPLYEAFRKYGSRFFTFEILEYCDLRRMNELEQYYIRLFNSYEKGYNQIPGTCKEFVTFDERKHIIQQYETTHNLSAIALDTGLSEHVVQEVINGSPKESTTVCPRCGSPKCKESKVCIRCRPKKRSDPPITKNELKFLIRTLSFEAIGRKFGVTGAAIKKWCKHYHLPWRRCDIDSFTDEEWDNLEFFDEKDKTIEYYYDENKVIELFLLTHSYKYIQSKINIPQCTIYDIKKRRGFGDMQPIEWTYTTCHIVGTDLYFQTSADAGHWLAETYDNMRKTHSHSRGRIVRESINRNEELFGYKFEYVDENMYFDIIERYSIISYRYQKLIVPN